MLGLSLENRRWTEYYRQEMETGRELGIMSLVCFLEAGLIVMVHPTWLFLIPLTCGLMLVLPLLYYVYSSRILRRYRGMTGKVYRAELDEVVRAVDHVMDGRNLRYEKKRTEIGAGPAMYNYVEVDYGIEFRFKLALFSYDRTYLFLREEDMEESDFTDLISDVDLKLENLHISNKYDIKRWDGEEGRKRATY